MSIGINGYSFISNLLAFSDVLINELSLCTPLRSRSTKRQSKFYSERKCLMHKCTKLIKRGLTDKAELIDKKIFLSHEAETQHNESIAIGKIRSNSTILVTFLDMLKICQF